MATDIRKDNKKAIPIRYEGLQWGWPRSQPCTGYSRFRGVLFLGVTGWLLYLLFIFKPDSNLWYQVKHECFVSLVLGVEIGSSGEWL